MQRRRCPLARQRTGERAAVPVAIDYPEGHGWASGELEGILGTVGQDFSLKYALAGHKKFIYRGRLKGVGQVW